jgi:hypothetical protein
MPAKPVITCGRKLLNTSLAGVALIAMATTLVWSLTGWDEVAAATLAQGDILVNDGVSTIIKIDLTTGNQTIVTTGGLLGYVGGMAIDADGQILVLDLCVQLVAPGIVRIDPATGAQTIVTMGGLIGPPNGCYGTPPLIAIDPNGQILVAATPPGSNSVRVIRVDPATGDQTVVPTIRWLPTPHGLAVVPAPTKRKK